MTRFGFVLLLLASGIFTYAQGDSLVIKLQYYKTLYSQGLIDSGEYALLKAKLLGITPQGMQPQGRNTKMPDTELYYDITETSKTLPKGIYMSLGEIKDRKPSLNCEPVLRIRNTWDYENGVGGNIWLKPKDQCISGHDLKMDAWLVSDGVRCYVNLEHLKLQPFYTTVLTRGRFLAFFKNQPDDGSEMVSAYGGFIAIDVSMATGHYYKKMYVIDLKADKLFVVNNDYMLQTLKEFPTLLEKYKTEKDPNAITFGSYLQQANDSK
jgi:hypothetical protein